MIFVVLLIISNVHQCVSDNVRSLLPPIYEMDDWTKCDLNTHFYCQIKIKLTSPNDSNIWRAIQGYKNQSDLFNNDELMRAKCFPKSSSDATSTAIAYTRLLHEKYQNLSLEFNMDEVFCRKFQDNLLGTYELFLIVALVTYLAFLLYATSMDYMKKTTNKYIKSFSVIYNWQQCFIKNHNQDFQKLKSMQGLRSLLIVFVITCHAEISIGSAYIKNTDYLEFILQNFITSNVLNFNLFVVQPFFVISAWLLALQVHQVLERNGEFTLTTVWKMFFNRVCRLWPPLALMVATHSSKLGYVLHTGPMIEFLDAEYANCRRSWWATLFFVNNLILDPKDVCNIGTWYISADTQLYLLSLLVLYLMINFKLGFKFLIYTLIFTMIGYGGLIYYHNVDMILQVNVESSVYNIVNSLSAKVVYFSTYSCASTFVVGLCFGTIYHRLQGKNIFTQRKMNFLFYFLNLLPFMVTIFCNTYNYKGVMGAIVGSILKPLFALGVAFFLLGLSQNKGGIVKRFLELDIFETMANFTFCTYLFHFMFCLEYLFNQTSLLEMTPINLIHIFSIIVFKALVIGVLIFFVVEKPLHNLQKMFGPKIYVTTKKTLSNKYN